MLVEDLLVVSRFSRESLTIVTVISFLELTVNKFAPTQQQHTLSLKEPGLSTAFLPPRHALNHQEPPQMLGRSPQQPCPGGDSAHGIPDERKAIYFKTCLILSDYSNIWILWVANLQVFLILRLHIHFFLIHKRIFSEKDIFHLMANTL